ncbi:MAG: Rrf2 family transcriptional regulator, partial [Angelakisella sp.]
MIDIAVHSEGGHIVPIASIALRQSLSEKYLEQIIAALAHAGFVKSVRGAQGGYHLTRAPQDYTVGEILRVMEGSLSPVSCAHCTGDAVCPRADNCVTIEVWRKLDDAIN